MKKTKQPRKQRKRLYNMPLHKKKKQMSVRLSDALRKDTKKRNITAVKGDKAKIMRGTHKGKEGKITIINRTTYKVGIEGVVVKKPDGKERALMMHPSNLMLTELKLTDEKRKKLIGR